MTFDYDVIILGSGPAGFSCAMQSSKFDKNVLMVEASDDHLGGTWINTGTVPSKALREAAKSIQKFHRQFGDESDRKPYEQFKMNDLLQYKRTILDSKNQKVKNDLIKNEIDTARGWGKVIDKNTVQVTDHLNNVKTYTTKNILISTGSSFEAPEAFSVNHSSVLDFESVLNLTHIPRRLVIVGNGIISFEYATIFSALGTRVTILADRSDMLPFLDEEIEKEVLGILKNSTIQIFYDVEVQHVSNNKLRTCTEVGFKSKEQGSRLQVVETEHVLFVGSTKPNAQNIGLEDSGVELSDEGFIKVDKYFNSSVDSIFAAGDVIGLPAQASASFVQGRLAACSMFDQKAHDLDGSIPYAIYSIPEISSIGLTEKDAAKQGIDVTVGRAYYKNITQADITHSDDGLLKLVFKTDDLTLVGVHIVGEQAADLIHLGQSVMSFGGNIRYFMEHVINYPTYSEAYRVAAFNGVNRVYKAGIKYKNILERSENN
ncbi:Si-specific NAD(P)(+) transhydrogenase [Rhodohalobacter sp. SW132]|uniref:Si-specific NAD(P)(+) transhydrogenase n=1 Tax=Rhodohalobacter sp. SW132 TaxID=2293433 RepID=UPI000E28007A|nr:Si-specific NAD(P)(+) transhydrogenase [Rhodohalobacter sp. SW132]REL24588.1 Si-specific NAD(P)(+) transhydrogenase [Rhodohalobacter sp. SW132]